MFNKDIFSDLLKKAMGDRTTTEYAERTGVNRTYISKLLNKKLENPPSPDIIRKLITEAYNGINYEELMLAAGYISASMIKESEVPYSLSKDTVPIGETKKVPVIGTIRCGDPMCAIQDITEWVDVPAAEVKDADYFFLQVKGDSMIGSRIHPGDRVLVRKQGYIENGQIAVALVNGYDATLKRVKYLEEAVILYPDNPKHQPQIYKTTEVIIIGRVVKVEFKL